MSLNYISKVIEEIKIVSGPIGKSVANKLNGVLARNPGYKYLNQISQYLTEYLTELPGNFTAACSSFYKYRPTTSVNVET